MIARPVQASPKAQYSFITESPQVPLPASCDLKADVTEVENQLQFSSCTANAGCSFMELMFKKSTGKTFDFSRMFLYWHERQLEHVTEDVGAYPCDIGGALQQFGVCLESTWGYGDATLNAEPTPEAHAEALKFRIKAYHQIVGSTVDALVYNIKACLASGYPVLLAMAVNQGFEQMNGKDWHTTDWDINLPNVGGHEMLIIGYDDNSGRFLVENSWGPDWCDGGFFGLPYKYINLQNQEFWTLEPDYSAADEVTPPPVPFDSLQHSWQIAAGFIAIGVIIWFLTH